jgi:O-6-methylguanine DNA methyltransferase
MTFTISSILGKQLSTKPSIFTCRCFKFNFQKLTLYVLTESERILHLTFSESHHITAGKKLAEAGIPVTEDGTEPPAWLLKPVHQYLKGTIDTLPFQVNRYFLDRGTSFQKKVWQQISAIPPGTTRTYGEIAGLMGSHGASRAVGRACHLNPLALIIPCHRVVGKNSIGGFAGGADTKKLLLQLEELSV